MGGAGRDQQLEPLTARLRSSCLGNAQVQHGLLGPVGRAALADVACMCALCNMTREGYTAAIPWATARLLMSSTGSAVPNSFSCNHAQADPEAALEMLRRAEAGAPPHSPLLVKALMSQASVLSTAGRPDEIPPLVRRAAELDPTVAASFRRPLREEAKHGK